MNVMESPPPNAPGHRIGFTLVELIVTITIIAVLASLSFVALRNVRTSARSATCVNNIKQIIATHNILAQETGGVIVHPWASVIQGSELRNWSEFHTIQLSDDFDWLQPVSDVNERMRNMEYLRCPTAYALQRSEMARLNDHRGWRTYGLNQKIGLNQDPDPSLRAWTDGARTVIEVVSPSKLVLVSEGGWEGSRNRYPGAIGPEAENAGYAGFHGGGFHVGYLDGHVERHTADTFLLTGKTLPNGQVGQWTNPEFALMWRGRLTPREVE
jgi:prepilin-type N-terminal cleavage/methylation domain-containing protein/prepilin-type processing-associated H-X9-DG protein